MNLLIVAATKLELEYLFEKCSEIKVENNTFFSLELNNFKFDILITGIGITNTVYELTKLLQSKNYDLIINAGIAGSFSSNNKIGDTVEVVEEQFAEIAYKDGKVQTLFEYGLMKDNGIFINGKLLNKQTLNSSLPKVKGITVNTIYPENSVLKKKFNVDIETMEGGAFFYVCLKEKVPFTEIRSISNFVGETDKNKWDIELASKNLAKQLMTIIDNLCL